MARNYAPGSVPRSGGCEDYISSRLNAEHICLYSVSYYYYDLRSVDLVFTLDQLIYQFSVRLIKCNFKLVPRIPASGGSRISRWGEALSRWGGTDLRCGCFLAKTYVKTKELDPVGGVHWWRPPWIRQCLHLSACY